MSKSLVSILRNVANVGDNYEMVKMLLKAQKNTDDEIEKLKFDSLIAYYRLEKGEIQRAMSMLKDIESHLMNQKEKQILFNMYNSQCEYYTNRNKLLQAIVFLRKMQEVVIFLDTRHKSKYLNSYAVLFKKKGWYRKALLTYQKSLKYAEKADSTDLYFARYCNIGEVYLKLQKNELAIKYYMLALGFAKKSDYNLGILKSKKKLGIIYLRNSNLNKAEAYLNASRRGFEKIYSRRDLMIIYYYLYRIKIQQQKFLAAWTNLKNSISLGKYLKDSNFLKQLEEVNTYQKFCSKYNYKRK